MDQLVKKGDAMPDMLSYGTVIYFEEAQLRYAFYASGIFITLLDHAFIGGKEAKTVTLRTPVGGGLEAYNYLSKELGEVTAATLRGYVENLQFEKNPERGHYESIDLGHSLTALVDFASGTRTYNPFALDRFRRLPEVPKKWTMAHCKRALANGQFTELKCNGKYSDDYAHDDAVNYHRGPIAASSLLQTLVTSPSGWWTSHDKETNEVNVCCHSFDSNSFSLHIGLPA